MSNIDKSELCDKLQRETNKTLIQCKRALEYCDYDYECAVYYLSLLPKFTIYDWSGMAELERKVEEFRIKKCTS